MNVEELFSMSSSLPIRENIWFATLNDAYSAGTNDPIWAIICSKTTWRKYVDLPL